MARGTKFGEILTMLREETGRAVSTALGQNEIGALKARLRRTYRWLHRDFDWPHLQIRRDKTVSAGERYISFPADIDFERLTPILEVKQAGGDIWYPVSYGIDARHYNYIDSDEGERDDWPRAWQFYEGDQIEIWPVPAQDGHQLRFRGFSRPKTLVDDNDTVDLDDDLVVLFAAQQQLRREKSADAEDYAQQARALYLKLKGRSIKSAPIDMANASDRDGGGKYPNIQIRYAERYD